MTLDVEEGNGVDLHDSVSKFTQKSKLDYMS